MLVGVPGPMELIILLGLGGGLPLGVPPADEVPLMANVAPEECVFYVTWAGAAEPDPNSPNRTEQLVAEPEVQFLVQEVIRQIENSLIQTAQREEPAVAPLVKDVSAWIQTLLKSPTAAFISEVKMTGEGPPEIRGGLVVRVGEDAAKLKAALEGYQARFLPPGIAQALPVVGDTWYRLKFDPEAPEITWGVRHNYLIMGIGEGSVEAIWTQAASPPPKWLTDLREQLPVDRVSSVTYVNVEKLTEMFIPMIRDRDFQAFWPASGLDKITSLASVTGLDEEGFVSKTLVGIEGEPTGLLSFVDAKPLTADDLAPIPADATLALAARVNAEAIFDTIADMVGRTSPHDRQEMDEGIAQMEQEFGIDLRNDILKAVGDTVCVYNSPHEGGLVFTGLTAVIPVKDHAALSAAHEKLIALAKAEMKRAEERYLEMAEEHGFYWRPQPRIEEFEFAGQKIYFLNIRGEVPFAPAWCLTETELIGALFPQNIKAYLSRGEDIESIAVVPEVAGVFEGGSGPVALAYADTPKLFDLVYPLVPFVAQVVFGELAREGIDINVSILPSAKSIRKHLRPDVVVLRRNAAGIELTGRQSLPGGALAPVMPAAFMLAPWMFFARSAPMPQEVMTAPAAMGEAPDIIHEERFIEKEEAYPVPKAVPVDPDTRPAYEFEPVPR